MRKVAFTLSAVALSLSLALSPLTVMAEESGTETTQQLPSLAPMIEKVMPAVVSIDIEGSQAVTSRISPRLRDFLGDNSLFCQPDSPFNNSPFCQGGGDSQGQTAKRAFQALGSGVIIDAAKGYVVTNNHLVENADKITVQLNDGRQIEAKVIGKDPRSDIALIQLKEMKNLTAVSLANSDGLKVGDYAVAIGNPFGLGETVTSGIISALGRSGLNTDNYENFIQTDAAINRGNSGGALLNLKGELIGINTAILAPDGGNIGIGFAIPSNMVKNLVEQIIKFGEVRRGELGIMGAELNAELATALKLDAQKGAFVSQVQPNSAAAKAGVKAGDVIVSLNGRPVSSFASLRAEVGSMPVGSELKLGVIRDGKPQEIKATLAQSAQSTVSSDTVFTGIEGASLSNYQAGDDTGVKIDSVKANTTAARVGLQKGDIILGVNQQRVQNIAELRKVLDTKPAILALNIRRGETELYILSR